MTTTQRVLISLSILFTSAAAIIMMADFIRSRDASLERYADCIASLAPTGMPLDLAWRAYSDECSTTPRPIVIQATTTAYSASSDETDDTPTIMASGKTVYQGAIACPKWLDFGTKVYINGTPHICEDRMAKRYRYTPHFDIFSPSKAEAFEYGRQSVEVVIIKQ